MCSLGQCIISVCSFNCIFIFSAVTCFDPGFFLNGRKSPEAGPYACNSIISYSCNIGYELQGVNTQRCQPSGQWSGAQPTCRQTCKCTLVFKQFLHILSNLIHVNTGRERLIRTRLIRSSA